MSSGRALTLTLAVTTVVQATASMAVLSVPVLGPRLAPGLQLPIVSLGCYVSLVYMAAALSSLLSGLVSPRLGPVRASQACLLLCGAGLLCIAWAAPATILLGPLLIGLGYGALAPASSDWLALNLPATNRGVLFSIKQTGVPLGGAMAGMLVPRLATSFDWKTALAGVALACFACAAVAQPLRREVDRQRDRSVRLTMSGARELWRLLCSSPALYTLAAASFWLSTFQLSLTTYLVAYLHDAFEYSLVAAGAALSAAQIAGVVGRLAWGALLDRGTGPLRVLLLLATGMLVGGAALAGLSAHPGSWLPLAVVCLVSAFALGWTGTFIAEVGRQAPDGSAGRAMGAALACTYVGVVVGPPVFGVIASASGSYREAFAAALVGPALAWSLLLIKRKSFSK